MKKYPAFTIATIIALCVLSFHIKAQKLPRLDFRKSKIEAKLGLGLAPTFLLDNVRAIVPPLSMKIECRLNKYFSLSSSWGYSSSTSEVSITKKQQRYQWQNRFLFLAAGGNFHRVINRRWEFYGGAQLGYGLSQVSFVNGESRELGKNLGIKPLSGAITWSSYFGMQHMITQKISLYSELGFGVSLVSMGIGYRLKG